MKNEEEMCLFVIEGYVNEFETKKKVLNFMNMID